MRTGQRDLFVRGILNFKSNEGGLVEKEERIARYK